MPSVEIADIPVTPNELEEYVAALFMASRYFVEVGVTERDETSILELDAVATNYADAVPQMVIAEAKSGGWGFPDLFKVIGWMQYLNIQKGGFFVTNEAADKSQALVSRKCGPHGLTLIHVADPGKVSAQFAAAGFGSPVDEIALTIGRLFFATERKLITVLRNAKRANLGQKGPSTVLQYHEIINNQIFFENDVRRRLYHLYSAYQEHPKLTLGVATELEGKTFDAHTPDPTNAIIRTALISDLHPTVQASFFVEHRARLAVIKSSIDYICQLEAGLLPTDPGKIEFRQVLYRLLPESVREAINELSKEPNFRRYGLLWQAFLWNLGGFYLKDREDIEFEWLSNLSGIPQQEIPRALEAFDVFFPVGGWLTNVGPSHCRMVKMLPLPIRGLGAIHRKLKYGIGSYDELGYTDYTAADLSKWHNALVNLLANAP
jgi:hypothetical protein